MPARIFLAPRKKGGFFFIFVFQCTIISILIHSMTNFVSDIAKAIEASLVTYAQVQKKSSIMHGYNSPEHFLEKVHEKFPNATLKRISGGALECGPGCLKALAQSRDDFATIRARVTSMAQKPGPHDLFFKSAEEKTDWCAEMKTASKKVDFLFVELGLIEFKLQDEVALGFVNQFDELVLNKMNDRITHLVAFSGGNHFDLVTLASRREGIGSPRSPIVVPPPVRV